MIIAEVTEHKSIAILNYIYELKNNLNIYFNVKVFNWNNFKLFKANIYHYHFSNSTAKVLLPLIITPSSKNYVTIHDILPRNKIWRSFLSPIIYRIINYKARIIIVHSKYAKDLLIRCFPYINRKKVNVIYFGSQPQIFDKMTYLKFRKKYKIKADELALLYLGYIKKSKGLNEAVDAFKEINDRKTKLFIVGKILDNETYTFLDYHNTKNLLYLGFIKESELREILTIIDGLLNFRSDSVGETSSAVMKSLSFGKPVIATDVGSNKEIIDGAGLIAINKTDQVNKLSSFINDKKLRLRLTKNAKLRSNNLNWRFQCNKYKEIFQL